LISSMPSFKEGLEYVQETIKGSMTVVIMTKEGIYAARDKFGRTPLVIGHKKDTFCITFENHAYLNLGYSFYKELGPGEIVFITSDKIKEISPAKSEMKICSFLWVYYGYPTASYEGVNVETMRYKCGELLAKRDNIDADIVAGVPDSGTAHAIGYANKSGIPFARPFIKYTPTWPRSFMPTNQSQRNLIAKMKLIPVQELIENNDILLIDDSIVRGTQLRETTEFLYNSGAKKVHVRPACPPLLFGCKYLNFSRSKSDYDLITRRIIREREGDNVSKELLFDYADPNSKNYEEMVEEIRKIQNFSSLRFHRLDDLIESMNRNREEGELEVQSRYSVVIASAKRARQLIDGEEPLIKGEEGKKPLSMAIEEISRNLVNVEKGLDYEEEPIIIPEKEGYSHYALDEDLEEDEDIEEDPEEKDEEEDFSERDEEEEDFGEDDYQSDSEA